MTEGKLVVAILFGGRSAEHEVSVRSAATVYAAMDRNRFLPMLIGIDRDGHWRLFDPAAFESLFRDSFIVPALGTRIAVAPGAGPFRFLLLDQTAQWSDPVDVVFPVLHGPHGEDGTVQGLLELTDVPYVGADVLGSAIGMDKDVQKRLLQKAGLSVAPFVTVREWEWREDRKTILEQLRGLRYPLFVKPARLGSSVGVTKVHALPELSAAIETALTYDDKILIEEGIDAREIECAVLGGWQASASVPGEIRSRREFYSYAAKYTDTDGAELVAPADLDAPVAAQVQDWALRVFQLLECYGMARVDFFLERGTGKLFVNEINTIPGFTSISMYPRLWELSGVPLPELVARLIELAFARHRIRSQRQLTVPTSP